MNTNLNKSTSSRLSNTNKPLKQLNNTNTNTNANTNTNTNTSTSNPSYVSYLANRIKNKLSSPLRSYLLIMIPVIFLLCYVVYKYNFNMRSKMSLNNMGYKDKIALEKMPQCYELDKTMQYKICDYYISASFMTPCIGNQHYDYLSIDMILEVIQSGARYIQIPFCESDISPQAIPVVATAEYGQKLITSLNTLDVKAVLNAIRTSAFKINKQIINYPLIIHLILNTRNQYTLNILSDNIKEVLSDIIILPKLYTKMPIYLEKMCNVLGKIILIATPEYQGTRLSQFIIPMPSLFNVYQHNEINSVGTSDTSDTSDTNTLSASSNISTNNKLSSTYQSKTNKIFKTKIPSIEYVINNSNSNTLRDTILNDKELTHNLLFFNKVGITLIKPHSYTDVISANYDPAEAILNGCQLVAMNFQINDTHMKTYIDIFKQSSFKLKPASMRFTDTEVPTRDILTLYKSIKPTNVNILNDIYYNYNNLLVAIESYQLPNTYLTHIEDNLVFSTGTGVNINKSKSSLTSPVSTELLGTGTGTGTSNQIIRKIGVNQCFIITKSSVGTGNEDIPIILVSASDTSKAITLNKSTTNYFELDQLATSKKNIINQSIYFEISALDLQKATDLNTGVQPGTVSINTLSKYSTYNKMLFIRNMSSTLSTSLDKDDSSSSDILYLAFDNKRAKAYYKSPQQEAYNNMTFKLHIIPFKIQIKLITLYAGSVKTMSGGIVGVLENNVKDGTMYSLEPTTTTLSSNFDYTKHEFYMKNNATDTYLSYDNITHFVYDTTKKPIQNSIFTFLMINGYYTLSNNIKYNLIMYNNNLLKFIKTSDVLTNENLFKIDINYELMS